MLITVILFWLSLWVLFFGYIGYGLFLFLFNQLKGAKTAVETELNKLGDMERSVVERFISRTKVSRHVEQEFRETLTTGQRVADYVAATMG